MEVVILTLIWLLIKMAQDNMKVKKELRDLKEMEESRDRRLTIKRNYGNNNINVTVRPRHFK